MRLIQFLPFFYFQQSRINTLKSFVFHFTYEWIPSIFLVLFFNDFVLSSLFDLFLFYLAFISIYEIGYIVNDQLAHELKDRIRTERLSTSSMFISVSLRLGTFFVITFLTNNQSNHHWWAWYSVLIIVFATHNLLSISSLKCITFVQLAFLRFLLPISFLIDPIILKMLFVPVCLNYVLFRLFIYMDSKKLINFIRDTDFFRIGYYGLLMTLSALLSLINQSLIPLVMNTYYLLVVLTFASAGWLGLPHGTEKNK